MKLSLNPQRKNNMYNKGDKASKVAKHQYLYKHFGRPTFCSNKKCQHKSNIFEWCLKAGRKYTHNPKDYLWLCRSCHRKYDLTDDKKNQAINNLWWKTGKVLNHAKGERCHTSKLTKDKVLTIRKMLKDGHSYKELSELFDITRVSVGEIFNRVTWKHI